MEIKLAEEKYELLNRTTFHIGMAVGAANKENGLPLVLLNDTLMDLYIQLRESDPTNSILELDGEDWLFGGCISCRFHSPGNYRLPQFAVVPVSSMRTEFISRPEREPETCTDLECD